MTLSLSSSCLSNVCLRMSMSSWSSEAVLWRRTDLQSLLIFRRFTVVFLSAFCNLSFRISSFSSGVSSTFFTPRLPPTTRFAFLGMMFNIWLVRQYSLSFSEIWISVMFKKTLGKVQSLLKEIVCFLKTTKWEKDLESKSIKWKNDQLYTYYN